MPQRVPFRSLFTLWWGTKWVRNLVLLFSPVGLIDSIFTLMLYQVHGSDAEYNPIVKGALESSLWPMWFAINTLSFPVLVMVVSSFYLVHRSKPRLGVMRLMMLVVALRIFGTAYDIFVFISHVDSLMWATFTGLATFVALNHLYTRDHDISVKGMKQWMQRYVDRFHDYLLLRGVEGRPEKEATVLEEKTTESGPAREERPESTTKPASRKFSVKIRRAMWCLAAVAVLILVPVVLDFVARIFRGERWHEVFGRFFYWNYQAGLIFVIGFVTVILMFSLMMYFLMRMFDESEGPW